MSLFASGSGRISNHTKRRVAMLNSLFPVGSQCRYTRIDGKEIVVTVAKEFGIISGEPMALFKEVYGWQDANRVRALEYDDPALRLLRAANHS